jgi:hypothetical protein
MLRASDQDDSGHFLWKKWGEIPSKPGFKMSVSSDSVGL